MHRDRKALRIVVRAPLKSLGHMDIKPRSEYFFSTMNTKPLILVVAIVALLAAPGPALADLPRSLLGITLGEDVAQFEDMLWMNSATRLADAPFLTEVNLKHREIPGIRGGSVTFGNCARPGTLIGAKFKFDDKDIGLFDKLYKLYEKKFGKPDEWQGDAFRTVRSWKWMISDGGQRINIVLTYSKDPGMRPGVSIKMVMHTLWMDEYECYHARLEEKHPPATPVPADELEISNFVPHQPGH
ncbi:hypothetical protein DPQ33_01760 [Oceanidesulfovibrio indonesiensis]|uniref:Uncharacterized protein n=1 Tax=Oceanidesulfovibrio indonesiensis TaxID=54767 RepID=A0A7M3MJI7_9BACT|nr:hypothetical protein [Oceanidesulfovibrio indonesiensis]TVM19977.1 hypothetical protein DPQ33_01760 [Oceanidesulfovibrio indonesiensis]